MLLLASGIRGLLPSAVTGCWIVLLRPNQLAGFAPESRKPEQPARPRLEIINTVTRLRIGNVLFTRVSAAPNLTARQGKVQACLARRGGPLLHQDLI